MSDTSTPSPCEMEKSMVDYRKGEGYVAYIPQVEVAA